MPSCPVCLRMGACTGKVLAGLWVAWACDSKLAAVGVFSSAKMAGVLLPDRFSEFRLETVPDAGPSDSSSSSSSDPARFMPSPCSLDMR